MAMTKKERAEVEALQARDAMLRGLAYPQFPRPVPMAELTTRSEGEQHGWIARCYRDEVHIEEAWRDSLYSYGTPPTEKKYRGGSQGRIVLYATEAEAYRAAAYDFAERAGVVLAAIYAKCFDAPAPSPTTKEG